MSEHAGRVVARYDQVQALLHHRDVVPVGTSRATELVHRELGATATGVRSMAETAQLLPLLRARWQHHVQGLIARPRAELFADLAVPWSLDVAVQVTGVSLEQLTPLLPLAGAVFVAAAESTTGRIPASAEQAAATLSSRLAEYGAADVQSVVALTHTLPCLLVNAWRLLWEQPAAVMVLQEGSATVASSLDELLRLAGPARAVFRECLAPVAVGGVHIPAGGRVTLLLHEANRDAAVFPDPGRLDFTRGAGLQLALGDGAHRCPGRNVVRGALHIAMEGWLELLPHWKRAAEQAGEPASPAKAPWRGGFAIDAPVALHVQPIVPVPAP